MPKSCLRFVLFFLFFSKAVEKAWYVRISIYMGSYCILTRFSQYAFYKRIKVIFTNTSTYLQVHRLTYCLSYHDAPHKRTTINLYRAFSRNKRTAKKKGEYSCIVIATSKNWLAAEKTIDIHHPEENGGHERIEERDQNMQSDLQKSRADWLHVGDGRIAPLIARFSPSRLWKNINSRLLYHSQTFITVL